MKMPKKMKNRWLKALRSGEYGQTKETLCNGKGNFCCLGVLQHVVSGGLIEIDEYSGAYLEEPSKQWYEENGIVLDKPGKEDMFGVEYRDHDERTLMIMNDGEQRGFGVVGRKNFKEIADWIEKNIEVVN